MCVAFNHPVIPSNFLKYLSKLFDSFFFYIYIGKIFKKIEKQIISNIVEIYSPPTNIKI
jgi:hypothetical protein